jgi:hypothetical protein
MKGAWVPVLVRDEPKMPPGNRAPIAQGAAPLRGSDLAESTAVHDLVESARADRRGKVAESSSPYLQETLFDTD